MFVSVFPIKSALLVMQQPERPLELAVASYQAQQHIPAEDRSSLRKIAEDFGILQPCHSADEGSPRPILKPITINKL